MKLYAALLVLCAITLGVLDVSTRSHISSDHPDQLDARYYEATIRADQGEGVYAAQMIELIERERWRRRANAGIPVLMGVLSILFLVIGGPRWLRMRRSPIPRIPGIVEVMTPEEVTSNRERFKEVQGVSFRRRADAVIFLRKAAPAERAGHVLGQVWKQIHYVDVEGKRKKLGSVWIAQLSV